MLVTPPGLTDLYRPDGQPFLSFLELDSRIKAAEQRAARLAAKLQELGIDPTDL